MPAKKKTLKTEIPILPTPLLPLGEARAIIRDLVALVDALKTRHNIIGDFSAVQRAKRFLEYG